MDPTIRLRIATRIHFALLRHYGEDVGVSTLLKGEADAREALWVCQASGHKELISLAKQFDTATRQETRAVRLRQQEARIEASTVALRGATPQDMAWSRNTSGFGLTRAPDAFDTTPVKSGSWLKTPSWLRLGATAT